MTPVGHRAYFTLPDTDIVEPVELDRIVSTLERHGERTTRQIMGVGVRQRSIWQAWKAGLLQFRPSSDARVRWSLK